MAIHHCGKTATKTFGWKLLALPLSEKQIPQVVERFESGGKPKEALETVELRPRQVRYQAALPGCATPRQYLRSTSPRRSTIIILWTRIRPCSAATSSPPPARPSLLPSSPGA